MMTRPPPRDDLGPAWFAVPTLLTTQRTLAVSWWIAVLVLAAGVLVGILVYRRALPRSPDALVAALAVAVASPPCGLVLYGPTHLGETVLWSAVLAVVCGLVWHSVRVSVSPTDRDLS